MPPILVVGPGALGGVLAARWAEAGQEVLLLGRKPVRGGLLFTGTSGRTRRIRAGLRGAGRPADCAAVVFCVKSADTGAAIKAARAWAGPDTPVVSLQNGLGHETLLRRAFGPARTVIGTCYIAADRTAPLAVTHKGGKNISLASNGKNRKALAAAAKLLRQGGWKVAVADSEDRLLWTKLCFNAAGNLLGAACAAPNGQLAKDPALRDILLSCMREAVAAARRDGHKPLIADMEAFIVKACLGAPEQRNSMLQDLAAGRRTEVEAIAGPVLAAARRTKTPAPMLSRLARVVSRLERLP